LTLHQDGALSHTAASKEKVNFIEPQMWPPNSPDLNPIDYTIWGALQQKVYVRHQFENVDQLKLALEAKWNRLSQTFINRSIDEWR